MILPRDLRQTLARDFTLSTPTVAARERSFDGTEKFLLRLADGRQVESVFIPDTPAMSVRGLRETHFDNGIVGNRSGSRR